MTSDKLTKAIEREKKNIERYEAMIADYTEKARASRAKLQQYEMMQNSQMFSALADIARKKSLSVDAILAALQSGDLLSLQEQMEAAQEEAPNGSDASGDFESALNSVDEG